MAERKTAGRAEATEAARAAERTLNDAVEKAKQLKAKSREAKRRVKAAKKAAKQASRAARVARKVVEKARRSYRKALARAAKEVRKVAKREKPIATPKRRTPSRNHPGSARRRDKISEPSQPRTWEVGEDAVDVGGTPGAETPTPPA